MFSSFVLRTRFLHNYTATELHKLPKLRSACIEMQRTDDDRLATFCRVCDEIGEERSYNNKALLLQRFLRDGTDNVGFKGDTLLWVQMLVPDATQRVYNLQNKKMIKLFSRLFVCDQEEMHLDLEQEGDVSETMRKFFESSKKLKPQPNSTLYLQEVDEFLVKLEKRTKEDEQSDLLRQLCKQATALDLKMIIRLIKQDLRINARARHILDAFGPLAYSVYQSSRDLAAVVRQFKDKLPSRVSPVKPTKKTIAKAGQVQLMSPIFPMLANACKSVEDAFKNNPTGLYSEIKYDGERVQIHKHGDKFKFFSRSLKPVLEYKIKRLEGFIPKAFPGASDMILDSEIILVDTVTGELLPFGTLGAHKQKEYALAEVCMFVFDCMLFNGEDLTSLTFRERRKILEDNIKPIKSHVQLSECHFLKSKNELSLMTAKVLKANLEGVVLKSPSGTYQPNKRGWLKVKKDYLFGGQMADSADLVVLGAWFGSGKKGGLLSIFLMGCYDPQDRLWKTVTKVHSGLDDVTMEETHAKLMRLMERTDPCRMPTWLLCKKLLVPDCVAMVPTKMPVWEITGANFTKSEAHTASGISIRFPRITKMRADKTANEANDMQYLQKLFVASKKNINVDLLVAGCDKDSWDDDKMEISSNSSSSPLKNDPDLPTTSKRAKRELDMSAGEKRETRASTSSKKSKSITLEELLGCPGCPAGQEQLNLELETNPYKSEDAHVSELFKNMVGYFDPDIGDERCRRLFAAHGGKITTDTMEATMSFYESSETYDNLAVLRSKYRNSCQHLSVHWVRDSLKWNECQNHPIYAVVLKSI